MDGIALSRQCSETFPTFDRMPRAALVALIEPEQVGCAHGVLTCRTCTRSFYLTRAYAMASNMPTHCNYELLAGHSTTLHHQRDVIEHKIRYRSETSELARGARQIRSIHASKLSWLPPKNRASRVCRTCGGECIQEMLVGRDAWLCCQLCASANHHCRKRADRDCS